MSQPRRKLRFKNDAEKRALLHLHDELARLTGDIDPEHALHISQAMVAPFQNRPELVWDSTKAKPKEPK